MILYVTFFYEAHGGSSGSVAYLNVARLERTWKAEGEKREAEVLFQAYAHRSWRAGVLLVAIAWNVAG